MQLGLCGDRLDGEIPSAPRRSCSCFGSDALLLAHRGLRHFAPFPSGLIVIPNRSAGTRASARGLPHLLPLHRARSIAPATRLQHVAVPAHVLCWRCCSWPADPGLPRYRAGPAWRSCRARRSVPATSFPDWPTVPALLRHHALGPSHRAGTGY